MSAVGTYHLLALLAFVPWFYSKTGVALAVIGIYVFGAFGMNLCYHRLLSHRSFSCPLWLEHGFAILAVWCVEDTPARWVATHRLHHHRSDERADPHSPLVNLFWSHMGWLFIENTDLGRNVAYDRYARDIIRDKFYRWIERYVVWITLAQSVLYFAVGFLIELALGGSTMAAAQFGASVWLWGVVVRTVFVWHITWSVNSFTHVSGYQNYETGDQSRNNVWVAIAASGEGWHNNHHAEPNSACNQRLLVGNRSDVPATASFGSAGACLGRSDAATLCQGTADQSLTDHSLHALRSAKCAPQNAIAAPRTSAANPASMPETVGRGLGAEAAWPALASTSTPTAIRNCRIRCGIWPDTALCISVAAK